MFADVACRDNGQDRACGAFRLFFGDDDYRNVLQVPLPYDKQSNNTAHLHAVIRALQIVYRTQPTDPKPVLVLTCSKYTVGHPLLFLIARTVSYLLLYVFDLYRPTVCVV